MLADAPTPRRTVPLVVLRVTKVAEPVDVYDITVEGDAPEFFAGTGQILVHNCKWRTPKASWDEGIMPSLRADLLGDHPRAFVTTTPKPVNLLQDWVRREDGSVHVIRGSTFDNRRNLSSAVVAELLKRYEGTSIGRQELYGEMLEAFDGALFTRLDLANNRVDDYPELVSIVVGVDPALTGEDDEMGIVVVGRAADNDMYVLEDASILAVGRAAALHAWRTFANWGADVLLIEQNLGRGWMEQVFRDAYYELVGQGLFPQNTTPPCRLVDARKGKKTRAEPVAMRSEQGRLHLVGYHGMLEDQLATFCSWDTKESPDRLDAMVHACRHLMAGEKKQARVAMPTQLSTTLQSLFAESDRW
jgi:phage terminase large subunit-like protein